MVVRRRLDLEGRALVFVTITVTNWLPVFSHDTIAELTTNQLQESLVHYSLSLVGYVIMPSHLHMLLGFQEIERLSKFVHSFKILTSKKVRMLLETSEDQTIRNALASLKHGDQFRFWKPRFDDLIVFSEEQFRVKLNYIHENPVKAGLVSKPEDWQYSSASDWLLNVDGPLPVDKEFKWFG